MTAVKVCADHVLIAEPPGALIRNEVSRFTGWVTIGPRSNGQRRLPVLG